MFTRYAYEPIDLGGYTIKKGEEVALILGATGRDNTVWSDPEYFNPDRIIKKIPHLGVAFISVLAQLSLVLKCRSLCQCCLLNFLKCS